ncbi:MAG: PEGA domain-containing protein [Myxococcota bacterium]|nr:PEGA domain-containing protein [Myxococcota bacterium]
MRRVVVAAACLSWASTAGAQPAEGGADEARDLFLRAVAGVAEGRYAEALADFESSYRLRPEAVVLYNIGMCRWEMRDLPGARTALRRYPEEAGGAGSAELLENAERIVAEIDRQVGFVDVAVRETGATVYLDAVEVGISPLVEPLVVMPGRHAVEARVEGRRPARAEVTVAAGERSRAVLELAELVVAPGLGVPPDDAIPAPRDDGAGWAFWTAAGVGSAAAVAAAVTGGLALKYEAEFEDGGARDGDRRDTAVTLAGVTDGLIGLAVAGAVAAVVLWLVGEEEEEPAEPVVGWAWTPGGLAVCW